MSARLLTAIAPKIDVTRARRSVAAWKPSQAPSERSADTGHEAHQLRPRRPAAIQPRVVDAEADRQADGDRREPRVVERGAGHRRDHEQDAREPPAKTKDDRVERPQNRARLAAEARLAADSHPEDREDGQGCEADHRPGDAHTECRLGHLGREVDRLRFVEGVVDPTGGQEGVDQPGAGCPLLRPDAGRVPEPPQHDLVAVREHGKKLFGRGLRRRREVELPADEKGFDIRRPHHGVLVVTGHGGPSVGELAATPDERSGRVPEVRSVPLLAGREVRPTRSSVDRRSSGVVAPNAQRGEGEVAQERLEPEPARIIVRSGEPRAQRHRPVERRAL